MKTLALLALVLAAEPPAARDPEILVARLGSSRYAEREAAANALEKLGRAALPALRAARHDKDAEVQSRAEGLLDAIERALLTRPTPIHLAGAERPLSERLDQLGKPLGTILTLAPGVDAGRPVRLDPPGPLTFWESLDRLGLGIWLWTPARPGRGRPPTLALEEPSGPTDPTSDIGPFRFALRDVIRRPGEAVLMIELMAEPRLGVRASEPPRLIEAIDELGRSLLPPVPRAAEGDGEALAFFEPDTPVLSPAHLDFQARLPLAERRPSRRLKRLRGTLAVVVEARRLEPEVITVAQAEGRPFWSGDATLVLRGLAPGAPGPPTLELVVRPPGWRGGGGFPMRRDFGLREALQAEIERVGQNFELVDNHGHASPIIIPNRRRRPFQFDPAGIHMLFDISTLADIGDPAQVRHHGLIQTTADLSFEFRDVDLR